MSTPTAEGCRGPFSFVCDLTSAVQGAATDYVLGGLGAAFVTGAAQVGELAMTALDTTTAIDLTADWFRANVAVIAAVTLPVVVALFVVQVIGSVLRREPGGLVRAVVGVGKAMLGAALALSVTQLALTAVDEICAYIAGAAGVTVGEAAARFFTFSPMLGFAPGLQVLVGFALTVGFVLLWGVLMFRKAALILVAVFAPIAFAGSTWDQTRVWTRRWLEVVAALVFCKIAIVVVFVVGASAFSGTGPTSSQPELPAPSATAALSDTLVGMLLLTIAIWAPRLTWQFVHWSGIEAGAVMHGAVAANPLSRMGRSAALGTRNVTRQVAMTMVTSGAGAAVRGAGAAAAARPGRPPVNRPVAPPAPPPAGGE